MSSELLYQVALTRIPGIGAVHAKLLIHAYGNATSIFKAPKKHLDLVEGLGTVKAAAIRSFKDFTHCEQELKFIAKNNIQPIFLTDAAYPKRLLNCYDSPAMLYYKGTANLNSAKVVSVVGTRNNSDYGKQVCDDLVKQLQSQHVLVVSGLAFGIDTIAHRAALANNLETVGVLAHGLDLLYPHQNKTLAKQMQEQGGLLTDFTSGGKPDKQNFPKRNRIVAGMCDCLVVIESSVRGGSLITAELANDYNKDVFAIPGRTTDLRSEGCNFLIKDNKAILITSADDLLAQMNWDQQAPLPKAIQRELFLQLSPEEKTIWDTLMPEPSVHVDALYFKTGLSSSAVAQALLSLEMQGLVASLPGKLYRLV